MAPTLTVSLPSFGPAPAGGWASLLELARTAEDAGVDRLVVTDHVVMGRNTDAYVWGRFPVPPDAPWLEPLTVLTALAAVTAQVRLATGILIAPLRPAALLAKQVATLDQLSGGRVDLGVGVGWQREEYEAEGLDFEGRGPRLTDTVAACRALWERCPATFSSPTVSFTDVFCSPAPVQARLPVWFGGSLNGRMVRRVVELGDGWIPIMGSTVDGIAEGAARLRTAFADAGRDPAGLSVQAPMPVVRGDDKRVDLAASAAGVPALVEAGATDVIVHLGALCRDVADAGPVLRTLAERFAAEAGVSATEAAVRDLLDRDALRRLVQAYATAVDHRELAVAAGCFLPDGRLTVGDGSPLEGRDAIVAALGRLERYEVTAHVLGHSNHVVDGDRATGESWCRAHHVYEEGGVRRDWVMAIRYVDRYVRAAGGWHIEDRHLVVDWLEDRPLEVR